MFLADSLENIDLLGTTCRATLKFTLETIEYLSTPTSTHTTTTTTSTQPIDKPQEQEPAPAEIFQDNKVTYEIHTLQFSHARVGKSWNSKRLAVNCGSPLHDRPLSNSRRCYSSCGVQATCVSPILSSLSS